ncbi:MAG: transketolase [bacterium]
MSEFVSLSNEELNELAARAKNVRQNIMKMVSNSKSGHIGGSMSSADIITTLYFKHMRHYPDWKNNADWDKRDRFVLSKGHASPVLYSVLAECGYIPQEQLMTFRKLHTKLQGHPAYGYIPGVEATTGSLGQGLSIANGIALALKLDNSKSRVYALTGDGELQEGQIWEAAMTSAHYNLGNLTVIVDRNTLQIDGCTEKVMGVDPVDQKFKAFGWEVLTIDGHDLNQIFVALKQAEKIGNEKQKPVAIVAKTVKGKGVSFMENNSGWHGKAPNESEFVAAMEELSK